MAWFLCRKISIFKNDRGSLSVRGIIIRLCGWHCCLTRSTAVSLSQAIPVGEQTGFWGGGGHLSVGPCSRSSSQFCLWHLRRVRWEGDERRDRLRSCRLEQGIAERDKGWIEYCSYLASQPPLVKTAGEEAMLLPVGIGAPRSIHWIHKPHWTCDCGNMMKNSESQFTR